jgi:general secretion pathway protein K
MKSRRGFALIATVWLMAAIAAVSLEVAWLARAQRLATANAVHGEQARAAARAGLEHARARLVRALEGARNDALADPWRWVGGRTIVVVGAADVAVELRDDAAALDVNRASVEMLARLFAACGADQPAARSAADRIADWRDADALPRPLGAERDEYLAAGRRALPRNGPVRTISELDDLIALPAEPWACARALLAVDGVARINPNTAPSVVLQALPGVSAAAADAIVSARRTGSRLRDFREVTAVVPAGLRADLERNAEALQRVLVYEADAMRVTSTALVAGSPVGVTAEALMRRSGPTLFVEWRSVQ